MRGTNKMDRNRFFVLSALGLGFLIGWSQQCKGALHGWRVQSEREVGLKMIQVQMYQTNMVYTFKFCSVICQLYLKKNN